MKDFLINVAVLVGFFTLVAAVNYIATSGIGVALLAVAAIWFILNLVGWGLGVQQPPPDR